MSKVQDQEGPEVKYADLQFAVKDINEVFGLKQGRIAAKHQILVDFVVGTIGACIGPDPENPGETIWTDPRAGQLKDGTMAVYDALTAQAPGPAAEPVAVGKSEVEKQTPEVAAAEAAGQPDPKEQPPQECPDFGKAYDPKDKACTEECLRPAECQAAMAEATKDKKKTTAAAAPKEKYSRADAFLQALKEGGTKEELADKSDANYVQNTGKKANPSEAKFWATNYLRLLVAMDLLKEQDGIITIKQ